MADQDRIGRTASIHYRGGILGEDPIDDRSDGEPLKVIIGGRQVPKGVDALLYELEVGEERTIELAPDLAYGEYTSDKCRWYPRSFIDRGYDLVEGSVILWTDKDREAQTPGRIVSATQDAVEIDFNHPLAGKTLEYWVKLEELN